jgi:DNA repair exonuclease SbcCD ATPase subunit
MPKHTTPLRNKLEQLRGQSELIQQKLTQTKTDLLDATARCSRWDEAQIFIQTVARETQGQLEYHLSEIVTLALAALWPDEGWRFRVRFELRRGRTEADLLFEDAEGHTIDPLSADGGGAADVAALALRLSLWSLRQPRSRATIVLDEPLRFLSTDLQAKASTLLRELAARLGLQFIIVTHEEELLEAADRVFKVAKRNGRSEVRTK